MVILRSYAVEAVIVSIVFRVFLFPDFQLPGNREIFLKISRGNSRNPKNPLDFWDSGNYRKIFREIFSSLIILTFF